MLFPPGQWVCLCATMDEAFGRRKWVFPSDVRSPCGVVVRPKLAILQVPVKLAASGAAERLDYHHPLIHQYRHRLSSRVNRVRGATGRRGLKRVPIACPLMSHGESQLRTRKMRVTIPIFRLDKRKGISNQRNPVLPVCCSRRGRLKFYKHVLNQRLAELRDRNCLLANGSPVVSSETNTHYTSSS